MDDIFIIAGLGNPGREYELTRHNVGFNTIDLLAERYGIKVSKIKFKALSGEGVIDKKRILLVKPQTYMNLSGESVREIVEWYKIPMSKMILVYDDIDLPLGKIRVRPGGSAGTHNGMRSVIYQLQNDIFPRVKIGIGNAPEGWDLKDYVLGRFNDEDRKIINESIAKAADAVETIIKSGIDAAMNIYNGK